MDRPTRFEHHRWLGDKRTQVAHDVDACTAPEVIEELMAAETFLCFGPDTLPEARNRGYRRCRACAGARAAAAERGDEGDQGATTGTAGGPGSPAARRTAPPAGDAPALGGPAGPSAGLGWPGDAGAPA